VKDNRTLDREELDSINNSELFYSFDPEEASWVIGGVSKRFTGTATAAPGEPSDYEMDFEIDY
jgi:hypothetical protein